MSAKMSMFAMALCSIMACVKDASSTGAPGKLI